MEEEKLNNLIYLLRIHHIDSEPLENLIKGYKELEEELEQRIEQKVLDYRYVDKEMIPKSKVKEVRNKFAEMVQKMYAGKKEITDHDVFILFDELLEGDK